MYPLTTANKPRHVLSKAQRQAPAGPKPIPPPRDGLHRSELQQVGGAVARDRHFAAPALYPMSNLPAMWNRLQPYIQHSPTLQGQLALLGQAGWTVNWNLHPGTFCMPFQRRIDIDAGAPDTVLVQNLAHETRHAFETPTEAGHYHRDVDYVDALMRNESVAVLNHMQVRAEILATSGRDIGVLYVYPAYYDRAVAFHARHGNGERLLHHVQRMYQWELTSVQMRSYWEVYANSWRARHGIVPIQVPQPVVEANRAQAWNNLSWEMNFG